jgi:2-methylcitrate dehydratase PrpD
VDRARVAFIDTVGVMLAGSRTEPAAIVLEMVKAEGAAPAVSIVGQSLRTSPQLAALANGVASHALDFDLTYTQGQLVASLIPALLPLAESTGATPAETLAAFIAGFEVVSRLSRANPDHNGGGSWHGTGTIGAISAASASAKLIKLAAKIAEVIGIGVSLGSGVNANYGTDQAAAAGRRRATA